MHFLTSLAIDRMLKMKDDNRIMKNVYRFLKFKKLDICPIFIQLVVLVLQKEIHSCRLLEYGKKRKEYLHVCVSLMLLTTFLERSDFLIKNNDLPIFVSNIEDSLEGT